MKILVDIQLLRRVLQSMHRLARGVPPDIETNETLEALSDEMRVCGWTIDATQGINGPVV